MDSIIEIIHYFCGLTELHLPGRVVFGINMAEDVLFNEVLLFMPTFYNFNIDILSIGNDNFNYKLRRRCY